jgi:hypothetical protein
MKGVGMLRAVFALIMWTAEEGFSGMSRRPVSSRLISPPGISVDIRPP